MGKKTCTTILTILVVIAVAKNVLFLLSKPSHRLQCRMTIRGQLKIELHHHIYQGLLPQLLHWNINNINVTIYKNEKQAVFTCMDDFPMPLEFDLIR